VALAAPFLSVSPLTSLIRLLKQNGETDEDATAAYDRPTADVDHLDRTRNNSINI
jgi:hypothetical protein